MTAAQALQYRLFRVSPRSGLKMIEPRLSLLRPHPSQRKQYTCCGLKGIDRTSRSTLNSAIGGVLSSTGLHLKPIDASRASIRCEARIP